MSTEDSSDSGGVADVDLSGSKAILFCNSEDDGKATPGAIQLDGDVESDSSEWEDCDEVEATDEERSPADLYGSVPSDPSEPVGYVEDRQEVVIEEVRYEESGGLSEEARFPEGDTSSLEGESGVGSSSIEAGHCRTWPGEEDVVTLDPFPSDEPLASATGKEAERAQVTNPYTPLDELNGEDLQNEEQYEDAVEEITMEDVGGSAMNVSSPLRVFCGHVEEERVEGVYEDIVRAREKPPDVMKPHVEVNGFQVVGEECDTSAMPQVLVCSCDMEFDSDVNPPRPVNIMIDGVTVPIYATTDQQKAGSDPVFSPYIPDYGRTPKTIHEHEQKDDVKPHVEERIEEEARGPHVADKVEESNVLGDGVSISEEKEKAPSSQTCAPHVEGKLHGDAIVPHVEERTIEADLRESTDYAVDVPAVTCCTSFDLVSAQKQHEDEDGVNDSMLGSSLLCQADPIASRQLALYNVHRCWQLRSIKDNFGFEGVLYFEQAPRRRGSFIGDPAA